MNKNTPKLYKYTSLIFAMIDFLMMAISYLIVIWISYQLGFTVPLENSFLITLILIISSLIAFIVLRLNKIILMHIGLRDVFNIGVFTITKNFLLMLFFLIFKNINYLPWQMFILLTPLEFILIMIPRGTIRISKLIKRYFNAKDGKAKTLIIGAGSGGAIVLKEINENPTLNYHVVGFVDDDENKINSSLNGIKVYGPISNIIEIIKELEVKRVIIAIAHLPPKTLSKLVKQLTEIEVKSQKIVVLSDLTEEKPIEIVDIRIEDLLNREPVILDNDRLEKLIQNKVILVTGGGGSIGSELCRQIVNYEPEKLIIFDIHENTTYDIQMELQRKFYKDKTLKTPKIEIVIGSVYNENRVKRLFEQFKPNIIFHAAAYKHVPLMEDNAVEAIRTNILGTYNMARLADIYKVEKMILVSTDKAVRPTNIMGATKRTAENIVQYQNSVAKTTSYSAVRFGNVLGSSGSVIPLFTKQISDGGPVTVTHKDINRFFMTIPEAVSLILLSGSYAKGGEIFVLDMGEPVKILDLAERMIRLVGYKPYEDIEIEFIGLRPGEKLYEEILIDSDLDIHKPTPNSKIFIEKEKFLSFEQLKIEEIKKSLDTLDNESAKQLIKSVIDTYRNSHK